MQNDERDYARCSLAMMRPNAVFVFGSNLAGIHKRGSAFDARFVWRAPMGEGIGRVSQRAYALPTKDGNLESLRLKKIAAHVEVFLDYAAHHLSETFVVTRIGCGYAGYVDEVIAPMFEGYPHNCDMPESWTKLLTIAPTLTIF